VSLSVPAGPPTSLAINSSELNIGGPMVGLTLSNGSFLLFGVARTKLTTNVVGNRLYLLRQTFLLILSPFRSTDIFDGVGTTSMARLPASQEMSPAAAAAAGWTGLIGPRFTMRRSDS